MSHAADASAAEQFLWWLSRDLTAGEAMEALGYPAQSNWRAVYAALCFAAREPTFVAGFHIADPMPRLNVAELSKHVDGLTPEQRGMFLTLVLWEIETGEPWAGTFGKLGELCNCHHAMAKRIADGLVLRHKVTRGQRGDGGVVFAVVGLDALKAREG